MAAALVLDLDRTLVHGTAGRHVAHAAFEVEVPAGWLRTRRLHVHVRPHAAALLAFLVEARAWLRVAVWTAGSAAYAEAVLAGLGAGWRDAVALVCSRDEAIALPAGSYAKPLSVVRRALGVDDVLLVDDDPVHASLTTNAVLLAPPFDAAAADDDDFLLELVARVRGARAAGRPLAACATA
jgi:TFIIF-interacting CTD phosphatase-like protein